MVISYSIVIGLIYGNLVCSTIFNDDKKRLQEISETFNLNIK